MWLAWGNLGLLTWRSGRVGLHHGLGDLLRMQSGRGLAGCGKRLLRRSSWRGLTCRGKRRLRGGSVGSGLLLSSAAFANNDNTTDVEKKGWEIV